MISLIELQQIDWNDGFKLARGGVSENSDSNCSDSLQHLGAVLAAAAEDACLDPIASQHTINPPLRSQGGMVFFAENVERRTGQIGCTSRVPR
ncbi:hypothetical protein [Mycolicibacterium farcinogenes]|uniref:hypothetical protein n=1 Tax=Mycolicibacterium farcinogenes TaxID=1802 RepID=UPI001FCFABAD|nr:hypothetical protein [Mycolicibacterium farcinogenes]